MKRLATITLLTACILLVGASVALAAGAGTGGLPWDTPIQSLVDNLTGPFLRAAIIIAIVVTGMGIGFAEAGSWLKRGLSVVCGLSVSAAAISWGLGFLGFAGGAGF